MYPTPPRAPNESRPRRVKFLWGSELPEGNDGRTRQSVAKESWGGPRCWRPARRRGQATRSMSSRRRFPSCRRRWRGPGHVARAGDAAPAAHRLLRGPDQRRDRGQPARARRGRRPRPGAPARARCAVPLHGIPIALKDNIHTTDMPTTGGALAFAGLVPPYEATLVANLRAAGAIILAKTQMTELANWVAAARHADQLQLARTATASTPTTRGATRARRPSTAGRRSPPAARARAPARPRASGPRTSAPRPPARSSARRTPTMLAAVKPTVGRISRHGIIPITADQDTAGPMARTVTDAAILLGVLEGAAPDPSDPATTRCAPPPGPTTRRSSTAAPCAARASASRAPTSTTR